MSYISRRSLVLSALSLSLLLTSGCSLLMPKPVELFQSKVKAVPEISESAQENQRRAADLLNRKLADALHAAEREHASTNITTPITGASHVADSLSGSLGPPSRPYTGTPDDLANKLNHDTAGLNEDIRDYAKNVDKNVGKKIEGTGLFQIGYFHMIGGILLLGALVWFGLKVYGLFNPIVGGVTSTIGRVSKTVLQKGFSQVVAGGEAFKEAVDQSHLDEKTADYIKKLFAASQKQAQDEDVKHVVAGITRYPEATIPPVPTIPPPPAQ